MLLKKIIAVVKECSKILLTAHNVENKITEKEGTANFVTDYDKQVQRMLQRKLSILLPQAAFLGEEDEEKRAGLVSLLVLTKRVLETCIDVLGFEAPSRM